MTERIYLEVKLVTGLPGLHMYLVKRLAPTQTAEINSFEWRSSGEVLRGGPPPGGGPFGTPLETQSGQLDNSEDRYASPEDVGNRLIIDITDNITGGVQRWSELQSALFRIAADNYDYEVPDFLDGKEHVANSNSTILSVLNAVDVDVRTLVNVPVVGATSFSTLLGTQGNIIEASSSLTSGLTLLGRDNFDDVFVGTKFGDRFYGEQEADFSATNDTVTYAATTKAVEVTLRGSGELVSRVTIQDVNGIDELIGIEKIVLTSFNDKVLLKSTIPEGIQEIDAGSQEGTDGDVIDVAVIRNVRFDAGQIVGSDIKFKNFETIVGGSESNRIVLAGSSTDTFQIKSIHGEGGDDIIVGGNSTATLFGGDGNDQLFAGSGGSILDGGISDGAGDRYVGGAGADIFVIGSGTHVKQGIDAKFRISNAGNDDRLVLRLDSTIGITGASETTGVVLKGGVYTQFNTFPNFGGYIIAIYSSNLISEGVGVSNPRPELGDFVASYSWDKNEKTLDIAITASYGDFTVHVDNFQEGQLGLNFTKNDIPGSPGWDSQWNARQLSLTQSMQIIDLPSAGEQVPGSAERWLPTAPSSVYFSGFDYTVGNFLSFGHFTLPGTSADTAYYKGGSYFQDEVPTDFWSHFKPWEGASAGSGGRSASFNNRHGGSNKFDPIVLDLEGGGFHLTDATLSNVYTDVLGTGFAVRTGWVLPTQGVVVRYDTATLPDINSVIGALSGNGIAELARYDSNSDGKIDANDAAATSLRIWVDEDGDQKATASELFTLAEADVQAINLSATASSQSINGNTIDHVGTFVRLDSSIGNFASVQFAVDSLHSVYTLPDGFSYSAGALALPEMAGYGTVPDLRIAMTLRPDLQAHVLQLVQQASSLTGAQFDDAFEAVVQDWANATSIDPAASGPLINAQHMAVVAAFYGRAFQPDVNLSDSVALETEATYQSIVDVMRVRFAAGFSDAFVASGGSASSAAVHPLSAFSAITYVAATDTISVDMGALLISVVSAAPTSIAEREHYFDFVARVVEGLRVDLFGEVKQALLAAVELAAEATGLGSGWQTQLLAEIGANSIIDAQGLGAIVTGTSGDDAILASSASQTLSGSSGSDTYIYSSTDGDVVIDENGSAMERDTLVFTNINASDVTLSRVDDNLTISINGTSRTVTVNQQFLLHNGNWGIDEISFADGSSWDLATINAHAWYRGTDGDDVIVGSSWNDTLYGGAGADQLYGGDGDDVIIGDDADTVLSGGNGRDTLIYTGSSDLQFAIGNTDFEVFKSGAGNDAVYGTSGNDELWLGVGNDLGQGYEGDDIIKGEDGDDVLMGFEGNDTLDGGAGADQFYGGDGDDIIIADDADTVLSGGDGRDTLIYAGSSDLQFAIGNTDFEVFKSGAGNDAIYGTSGNDELWLGAGNDLGQGYEGNDTIKGEDGDDVLMGFEGNDILDGGRGNDTLIGGSESDTFVFRSNFGQDTITDFATGQDFLEFHDGIFVDSAAAFASAIASGNDTIITIDASTSVLLQNVAFANLHVDDFRVI